MSWTPLEARWRDALMAGLLPAPGRGLPGLSALDLTAFWRRFGEVAPVHLRLGLRAATWALGPLPLALGHGRSLAGLDDVARDAVLSRAAELPGLRELVEVAKVVACLAYFSDPGVQQTARGPR